MASLLPRPDMRAEAPCDIETQIRAELAARQTDVDPAQRDVIGQFYFPKSEPGSFDAQVRVQLTDSTSERLHAARLCSADGVERIVELLQEHAVPPAQPMLNIPRDGGGPRVPYEGFRQVMAACSADEALACRLLRPDLFLASSQDAEGTVSLQDLSDVLHTCSHRLALWEQAARFDADGDGHLTLDDVESLVAAVADRMGYLPPEPLLQHWLVVAPRKVWFLLARGATVPLKALAASDALLDASGYDPDSMQPTRGLDWFAPEKSAAVVQRFCELRGDNEAFALFPHQLMDVRRATLDPKRVPCTVQSMVPLFVDRIFEVHVRGHCPVTGKPAMSLAEFADFLLAWNYRGHLASIKYFFKVLDVEHVGHLSAAVLDMWCEHVREIAVDQMASLLDYDARDVRSELWDIVRPKDVRFITMDDLRACDLVDTICGILVDGECHFDYDQREALAQQKQQQEGQ